jgi:hypothetical protein
MPFRPINDRSFSPSAPADWQTRPAFRLRDRCFTFLDVLRASAIRGDLDALIHKSLHAARCEQRAADEGRDSDMDAVEESINEFRYAHSLVTVEETEAWLEQHGLTADDLSDHFLRRHWIGVFAHRSERLNDEIPDEPDLAAPGWPADLVLSGGFGRLARSLARELACIAGRQDSAAESDGELLLKFATRRGLDAEAQDSWKQAWSLTDPSLIEFLRAQRQYEQDRQKVLSPGRRAGALAEFRSSLARLEVAVVEFDTATAAREAYLCVTADGLSLEDLAAETGYPLRREAAFLRDFPESWHPTLLGACPGHTLPPLRRGDLLEVCRVLDHSEPRLEDPAVLAELDGVLLERHFGHLESREIHWCIPREGAA